MAKVRKYSADLELFADMPARPGDGYLLGVKRTATQSLGGLVNNGWSFANPKIEPTEQSGRYKMVLPLMKVNAHRRFEAESAATKASQILDKLAMRLPGWRKAGDSTDSLVDYSIAELLKFPDNIEDYFGHIYDRELHIKEILDSIALARDTNMRIRHHTLLYGYPASGKSKLVSVLTKIFGDISVKRLDATSLTKSGAEKVLLESTPVPPIIVLEEVEKTSEQNLSWVLAVLDDRAEIIKTTSRGDISRLTRCLCIATANNVDKLKNFHEGAVYSRFNNKLYCRLPDDTLLRKILLDEVKNIPGGKEEWISPALEYAEDIEKTYDARRILAIMSLGRDRLLTGEYQEQHMRLRAIEHEDSTRVSKYNVEGE